MYPQHRPQQAPAPPNRLGDLLEQVRAEFDAQATRSNDYDHQYPAVAGQLNEMELIRSKIYQLEQTHIAMKNK
ncbi:hypothetical protein KC350_g13754, partial [Hortaea werneckii]